MVRQNNIFTQYYAKYFINAKLEKVYHYQHAYGGFPLYKIGDIDGLDFHSENGNNYIFSEFSSPDGDFIVIVNNMQQAESADKAFGTYKGKEFLFRLAPGQMAILNISF